MSLDCCVAALPLPLLQLIFLHVVEQQGSSVGLCRVSAVCKAWSEAVLSDPDWCGRLCTLCTSLAKISMRLSTLQAAYQHPQDPECPLRRLLFEAPSPQSQEPVENHQAARLPQAQHLLHLGGAVEQQATCTGEHTQLFPMAMH